MPIPVQLSGPLEDSEVARHLAAWKREDWKLNSMAAKQLPRHGPRRFIR